MLTRAQSPEPREPVPRPDRCAAGASARENNVAVSSQPSAVSAEFAMILLKADGWKLKATDLVTSSSDPGRRCVVPDPQVEPHSAGDAFRLAAIGVFERNG